MTTVFSFSTDAALPPALAAKMQAVADRRAAAGLVSADGKTHRNAASLAVYNDGHSTKSAEYLDAAFGKAVL